MKRCLISVFLIVVGLVFVSAKPIETVVIIGGGPAGLATAIEASLSGARVVVVEKRGSYERHQRLFLFEHSLELLKKWGVDSEELIIIGEGKDSFGLIRIACLEEALLESAKKLGISVLQDEFVHLSKNEKSVVLREELTLPYDILVAADGVHSSLRQALGIEVDLISRGKAAAALIPCPGNDVTEINISQDIQHGAFFIKKFDLPGMHFMFLQSPNSANAEDFITMCKVNGWNCQAEQIARGQARLLLDVDVHLQKSRHYCHPIKRALIVGDAAGTGSFFQGMGANHAFLTAEIAGRYFNCRDLDTFEREMKEVTDALIENSAFLFMDIN